jgi:flagellar hook-associated protein 3 FlgL
VLTARTEEHTNSQFTKNINHAKSFLEFTDQSLNELSDLVVRAKELAISQSNDASSNVQSRQVTAQEINQIYNQAIQIGNRKLGERYIFSGFKTQTQPFDITGNYFGDSGDLKVQTQKDQFLAMNLPGSKVFLGQGLAPDGTVRPGQVSPQRVEDLDSVLQNENQSEEINRLDQESKILLRGPASQGQRAGIQPTDPTNQDPGENIFQVLKGLQISLQTNDRKSIQSSLDVLDQALSQIIHRLNPL